MTANFLLKNIKWNLNQNASDSLIGLSTTEQQFYDQLEKLSRRYFPERKKIETLDTEFDLNSIALKTAKTEAQKTAKNYFAEYWSRYSRLKKVFDKNYLFFPSYANKTRLECAAELIVKCTQMTANRLQTEKLTEAACRILSLTERETLYIASVVELYAIKYYCAAASAVFRNKNFGAVSLARALKPALLAQRFSQNTKYCQASYGQSRLISVVDCMGNSAAKFDDVTTKVSSKLFIYANGRNVFDTFVESKFGQNTAEFQSHTKTVKVNMQYFLQGTAEVRKVTIRNIGKKKRKYCVEIPVKYSAENNESNYFTMDDALCVADGEKLFVATAVVADNAIVPCYGDQARNCEFTIEANAEARFDIVTIYSAGTPELAQELRNLTFFGSTECPYLTDAPSNSVRYSNISLNVTSHGYLLKRPKTETSRQINYAYQLGNNSEATFIDNAGNSTTLINGFAFGVRGESIYSVRGGLMDRINEDSFRLDADRLTYEKGNATTTVFHDDGKNYVINYVKPCKTLFYFPLERKSDINLKDNEFTIQDEERKYRICCYGEIESYSSNALECNEEKLRYKLSNNLEAGSCLAVCFKTSKQVKVTIHSEQSYPASQPIIRESLVSTYLNYINDKNVFCLVNRLKKADALTVAAICYTNPKFVREYLERNFKTDCSCYYYDSSGKIKAHRDRLTYPLAYVYYLNLTGCDLPEAMREKVNGIIFNEQFEGKELCVKALFLKKAAQLNSADKVSYLVEYNQLKKLICSDAKLYGYAQVIGAVPLTNPSKARLKDLSAKYDLPKCWYYVSQLENLYGLAISSGTVRVCPQVTAENVLEQLAITLDGKRIDTTFYKSSVRSMTLNGAQCYQPFYPIKLKNADNELVVRY